MIYEILRPKPQLVFIRWYETPTRDEAFAFVEEILCLLDESPVSIYVISDLRFGYVGDADAIQSLAKISEHRNWGGGTAFDGDNSMAGTFAGMFSRLSNSPDPQHQIWHTPEDAFAFIESLCEGITDGLDIAALVDNPDADASAVLS
jgi:hypothetical protein